MISKSELDEAIAELENAEPTMKSCEKLSALYTVRNNAYLQHEAGVGYSYAESSPPAVQREIVGNYGASEFLSAIEGKETQQLLGLIDELMSTIYEIKPKLYHAVIRRIEKL